MGFGSIAKVTDLGRVDGPGRTLWLVHCRDDDGDALADVGYDERMLTDWCKG